MNSSEFPRIAKTPQESPKNSQSSLRIPKNSQSSPLRISQMIQGTTTVAGEAGGFIVAAGFHRGHLSDEHFRRCTHGI